jgi:hypothetical protein
LGSGNFEQVRGINPPVILRKSLLSSLFMKFSGSKNKSKPAEFILDIWILDIGSLTIKENQKWSNKKSMFYRNNYLEFLARKGD